MRRKEVRKKGMISIGIDAGKKKCVATLNRDGSRQIVEQMVFQNARAGIMQHLIKTFIQSKSEINLYFPRYICCINGKEGGLG